MESKQPAEMSTIGDNPPPIDKKVRHCRICGTKLSIYRVNTKYCSAHQWKGTLLEDRENQIKQSHYYKQYVKGKKNGNSTNRV
jgi:hypothetical protein